MRCLLLFTPCCSCAVAHSCGLPFPGAALALPCGGPAMMRASAAAAVPATAMSLREMSLPAAAGRRAMWASSALQLLEKRGDTCLICTVTSGRCWPPPPASLAACPLWGWRPLECPQKLRCQLSAGMAALGSGVERSAAQARALLTPKRKNSHRNRQHSCQVGPQMTDTSTVQADDIADCLLKI